MTVVITFENGTKPLRMTMSQWEVTEYRKSDWLWPQQGSKNASKWNYMNQAILALCLFVLEQSHSVRRGASGKQLSTATQTDSDHTCSK